MLPEDHVRRDNKIFEEIYMPIAITPDLNVKDERISISSLDKVSCVSLKK